jgi:hypothetical protein
MASCMLRMYTETSCVDLSIFSKYTPANPEVKTRIPQEGRLVDRLRLRPFSSEASTFSMEDS